MMRILKSLFLGLALVTASYAQQTTQLTDDRLANSKKDLQVSTKDLAEPELKPLAINERPDKQAIAAIVALKGGNNLWRRGQLELAAAGYREAIDLDPELFAAHYNLGLARLQLKRFSNAISAFERALALRPQAAAAWQGLGLAHYYQEQYPAAIKALEQAQRLAPNEPRYNNNLGFVYMFVDRFDEAIASFKTTLELDNDFVTAKLGLCGGYTLGRQANEAVGVCLEAAKSNTASAVPQYFLGHAYLDLGDVQKSITAFEEASRIEPGTAKILIGLGFAYFRGNKYERALSYFQHARQLDANVDALSGIAASYAQLRKFDKAELVLREALVRKPDHHVNHFNLGVVCLRRKNRDCALTQYNYLKLNSDELAKKLFTSIYGDKVIDVTAYQNKQRR